MRQWHPDINPGNVQAEQMAKDINAAYSLLIKYYFQSNMLDLFEIMMTGKAGRQPKEKSSEKIQAEYNRRQRQKEEYQKTQDGGEQEPFENGMEANMTFTKMMKKNLMVVTLMILALMDLHIIQQQQFL